jgi:HCOMODA/2-hydroxy-3-carboxy-muconic semialdehyde decarboxylase
MQHLASRRQFLTTCALGISGLVVTRGQEFAGQARGSATSPTETIKDLVAANRILAHEQILDAFGHVSVRHPRNADHFLLARSLAPALVEAADILEYDLDANPVVARAGASYRERFIHSEIYRARPNVNAVVHCHTASLIPFGVTGVALRPIYHQSAFIAEGVPVFEIRSVAGMTDMLIKDGTLGRALARTLGNRPAALMRGHGAVVVADSLPTVVGRSVYLDMNARLQAQAVMLGGTVTYLSPEEARLYVASNNYDRAWELWRREVNR